MLFVESCLLIELIDDHALFPFELTSMACVEVDHEHFFLRMRFKELLDRVLGREYLLLSRIDHLLDAVWAVIIVWMTAVLAHHIFE